jgi:hypothetical protein
MPETLHRNTLAVWRGLPSDASESWTCRFLRGKKEQGSACPWARMPRTPVGGYPCLATWHALEG